MFFLRKFNVRKLSLFDWLNTVSSTASVGQGWVSTGRRFYHGVVALGWNIVFTSAAQFAFETNYLYYFISCPSKSCFVITNHKAATRFLKKGLQTV